MQDTHSLGFQKEKYDDYVCDLRWDKAQLKGLLSERFALMSQKRFDGKAPAFDQIFARQVSGKNPFDYIIDRTLNRPRDVLAFMNFCFKHSAGKSEISASVVKEAEREYSMGRYTALIDEWKCAFPALPEILAYVAKHGPLSTFGDLSNKEATDDLVMKVLDERYKRDPIWELANNALESVGEQEIDALLKASIQVLYRVGAIGIKGDYALDTP